MDFCIKQHTNKAKINLYKYGCPNPDKTEQVFIYFNYSHKALHVVDKDVRASNDWSQSRWSRKIIMTVITRL